MPLVSVTAGQPIRSTHVSQFVRWVTAATKDQSATFTTTHATEYTVTITNEETSAGNALKIVSGASTIALFNKTGATISVPLTASGVVVSSILASAGSMIGASAASTPAHIPKGSAFQSLVMNGAATGQTWATSLLSLIQTVGDLAVGSATNAAVRLGIGTAGQVLTASGGTAIWASLPAGSLPASDGTVTAPTINFSSETSTGLFRVTSGTIGFAGAAATAATLSSATASGLQMATNVPIVPAAVSGTPVQHALYRDNLVKGWVYYTSITTTSNLASYNVSSLTDGGTGLTTVVWDRDFSSANYAALGNPDNDSVAALMLLTARSTGTSTFQAINVGATAVDCHGNVIVLGAQ